MPVAFAAIYAFSYVNVKNDKGRALALSSVLYMLLVLVITNVLSVFSAITGGMLFVCYLIVTIAFSIIPVKCFIKKRKESAEKEKRKKEKRTKKNDEELAYNIMYALIIALFVFLLFGALYTVPYNYDSMTYHLARVGHWIDHKNVAHYITNIDRQIYSPVLCEYFLMHIMLLTGSDILVNLLQFFCLLSSTYFVFAICRKLKVNKVLSMLGAFVFATMPLSISESITTQNDLFATLIFLLFIYYLIDVISWDKIEMNKEQIITIFLLSATVAFAYLAKTSVCASMVMFMPWLLVSRIIKKDRISKLIAAAVSAGVMILILISETLIRTLKSAGSIMTDTASGDIMVSTKNVAYIIVNICKNFSMLITQHLFRPLNGVIYRFTIALARVLNVEVNNEAIAFHGFDFIRHMNMGDDMYSHDKTPSALAAYLALFAGVVIVICLINALIKKIKKSSDDNADTKDDYVFPLGFAISNWLSFGFIMALLRWQPWGTRLLYPALSVTVIMSVAAIEAVITTVHKKNEGAKKTAMFAVLTIIALLSVVLCIPSVTYNLKPAVDNFNKKAGSRMEQYFVFNRRQDSYYKIVSMAKAFEVKDVGVLISGDGYDYPLWLMFKTEDPDAVLRHVTEPPGEGKTEFSEDAINNPPDAIVVSERDQYELNKEYYYGDAVYICQFVDPGNGDAIIVRK